MKVLSLLLILAIATDSCSEGSREKKQDDEGSLKVEESKVEITEEETVMENEEITNDSEVEIVEIKTELGEIYIWLYDQTPLHKKNFLKLAKEGFYDGTTFHRVIDNFMIQGGDPNSKDDDPTNDGQGGPGYNIKAEIIPGLKHKYGSVAAARMGDNVNPQRKSSGSQFYIVENANGTPHLDGQYTVFGEVIKGMDVVEAIAAQKVDRMSRPFENIKMDVDVFEMTVEEVREEYDFNVPR